MKRLVRIYGAVFIVLVALLGAGWMHTTAFASNYGSGAYSSCTYDCPTPPTITTIPSGLQVAINLTSGQDIPLSGYQITVTPINGQGATIQKAEFFVNGQLAFTGTPDQDGTTYWQWVPQNVGDMQMHIIIYGTDGSQTTDDFLLHVVSGSASSQASVAPKQQPKKGVAATLPTLQRILQGVRRAIEKTVRRLPTPIVYSFPYLLFALLGTMLLLFTLQIRREVRGMLALRNTVANERRIAGEKEMFLQLSEHYLRTPATLIRNGAEALTTLSRANVLPPATIAVITGLGDQLHNNVELAIGRLASNEPLATIPSLNEAASIRPLWFSAGFLLPVAGFLVLLGVTEYLVQNVRQLNITTINQIVQAMLAGLLLAVFYRVLRHRQLRRRELANLELSLQHQRAVDDARNAFIRENAQVFSADTNQLLATLPNNVSDVSIATIREGCERFRKVINQFAAASQLSVGQSQDPLVNVDIAQTFAEAERQADKTLQEHHTTIQVDQRTNEIYCRKPEWLSFVLASLLDNASAYSPDGSAVTLSASAGRLAVIDQGAGIAPDAVKSLFKPFVRAEGALEFTHQGLGFGLYLDKLIMAYLGGDIAAESKIGKGTVMTLLLPQPASSGAPTVV